ncbi:DHA2 family efflux MFS transporter permease subunit [Limnohabitans sp. Hippo4]|uniref:DHA2 family efflux MFS transporter permease subunit n=1 Tax=Limnohabitans sp. Hippo4 TaxID=1826167 RepID=UPI000D3C3587|nr:DHA2 family efflux MFS transporter permease subunit [Limnohabitans sp. Hippo4]PUE38073.1 MFS transporter [Limnohabitans sp. Hippo4]
MSTKSPWTAFWIACSATFLVAIDSTMLFAAFDALRKSFVGTSAAELSWVLNAYTVVYAAMLIPAGGLADAHGRRRIFRLGLTLFLAASVACGAAPSIDWLIVARVVQALGAALLTPASMSIVLAAFPTEKRAVAVSLWGAVGGLAAAVGPSLGSWVTASAGWPWAFYINLPVGIWALWRSASRIEEAVKPEQSRSVDFVGLVLLMLAVGAIALAIVESGESRWTSSQIVLVAGAGLVACACFVLWAKLKTNALIDLSLFQHRTYRYVNAATLVFGTAFSMMFLGFFFFMMGVWHYSLPQAGLAVTPGPLLVMPTAIVTGRLASRLGHRRFLVGGSLLYALSSLWFIWVPGNEPNYVTHWLPGLLMSGISVGLILPSLSAAAVNRLPAEHYAVGSAVNQATRQIGSVLGVSITVALLGHATLQRIDFNALYILHIALALLTGLLCWPVDTKPRAAQTEQK